MCEMDVSGCQFPEWVPVKAHFTPCQRDAAHDLRLEMHVSVIVVIDEIVLQRLAEDDPDERRECDADGESLPTLARKTSPSP